MNRWHNHYADNHPHFCTATITDWRPLLVGESIQILYDIWEEARQALSVKLLTYVVMPDHYHHLLWAEQGKSVSAFLQRTASLTRKRMQTNGPLFKEAPRVLAVYTPDVFETKLDYIHRNPLRKELVSEPEEWLHSSYRQLVLGCEDVPFLCDDWDGVL
ncbi:MAG: transposase [Armatimonadota bacterium]|nr:transposase [Armatimonadota bacterium]